jgi:hypothetical protein
VIQICLHTRYPNSNRPCLSNITLVAVCITASKESLQYWVKLSTTFKFALKFARQWYHVKVNLESSNDLITVGSDSSHKRNRARCFHAPMLNTERSNPFFVTINQMPLWSIGCSQAVVTCIIYTIFSVLRHFLTVPTTRFGSLYREQIGAVVEPLIWNRFSPQQQQSLKCAVNQ